MFKKGDLIIYFLISSTLLILVSHINAMPVVEASKVEVYVNSRLKEVHRLSKEKKEVFIPTDIGGVKLVLYDYGVEVLSSNSPRKLVVKQGFIQKTGQTLIGVPDKLLIKIVGEDKDDLDVILR